MYNTPRFEIKSWFIWGCLILTSLLISLILSFPAQASHPMNAAGQISTAMYIGEGQYTVDAVWQGTQYADICSGREYKGDVALTLFDDGTFALIFTAEKHYEVWATLGQSARCIGPVRPGSMVNHFFIGTYTSDPLKLNFQRAFSVSNGTDEREMRFSGGQASFSDSGAVGQVETWMYINTEWDAEAKATFTLRFDLSRAGGAILATPTTTEAVGACYPVIGNIDNLKPGDVLSPDIDFVDENSKPVGIIGYSLFINGVETWSVVWDGKATTLEIQYTCLDHSGNVKVITIPAYQGGAGSSEGDTGAPPLSHPSGDDSSAPPLPPPAGENGALPQPGEGSAIQPEQGSSAPSLPAPNIPITLPIAISVLGMAVGLGGAAVSGGAVVVSVLNTVTNRPPTPQKPPAPKPTSQPAKQETPKEKQAEKGKDKGSEKEQKEKKEAKPERKGLLESEKEALEQYKERLDTLADGVEKSMDLLDRMSGISPQTKKRLMDELSDFKDKLGDMSDRVGGYTDKIEMILDIQNKIKSLGNKYQQIQRAHQEAFKDLQGLPEGTANQVADLTTAIETFGDVADAALSRIPYFKHIYSDEAFEVTKSFKEFAKGLRKLVKTLHHTTIEAKDVFTQKELETFGLKPDHRLSPEMQQFYREQARKQPKPKSDGFWQKLKDFFFGKEVSPEHKSMR